MPRRLFRFFQPTLRYWLETEVHVYCFAVSASVILSFFPFLIVMVSIFRYVLHWNAGIDAIFIALNDYFPDRIVDFVRPRLVLARRIEWVSILLLLFTANGVFLPLEVALNRAWGITKNRSFLRNQVVSLALIFACGSLALLSGTATALNQSWLTRFQFGGAEAQGFVAAVAFKLAAIPVVIAVLFLVYWLLPNGKMPFNRIVPAAIIVGLLLEFLKYINLLLWPWLSVKLSREYGPFIISVTIILFSFSASMLFLAGAEWASRPFRAAPASVPGPEPPLAEKTV